MSDERRELSTRRAKLLINATKYAKASSSRKSSQMERRGRPMTWGARRSITDTGTHAHTWSQRKLEPSDSPEEGPGPRGAHMRGIKCCKPLLSYDRTRRTRSSPKHTCERLTLRRNCRTMSRARGDRPTALERPRLPRPTMCASSKGVFKPKCLRTQGTSNTPSPGPEGPGFAKGQVGRSQGHMAGTKGQRAPGP